MPKNTNKICRDNVMTFTQFDKNWEYMLSICIVWLYYVSLRLLLDNFLCLVCGLLEKKIAHGGIGSTWDVIFIRAHRKG